MHNKIIKLYAAIYKIYLQNKVSGMRVSKSLLYPIRPKLGHYHNYTCNEKTKWNFTLQFTFGITHI